MAILAAAAAIVAIVLLSSGSDDDKSGTADTVATGPGASTQTTETSGTQSGSDGASTTGTRTNQADDETRARSRPRRSSRRAPHSQTQGRLGPQTGGSPAQPGTPARPTDKIKLATINVVGGSAVGGVQRVRLAKGKRARLVVYSDSDEVVVIPDYGLKERVQPGSSARFYFKASKKGLFEVLLENGRTRIGVLQVE